MLLEKYALINYIYIIVYYKKYLKNIKYSFFIYYYTKKEYKMKYNCYFFP